MGEEEASEEAGGVATRPSFDLWERGVSKRTGFSAAAEASSAASRRGMFKARLTALILSNAVVATVMEEEPSQKSCKAMGKP